MTHPETILAHLRTYRAITPGVAETLGMDKAALGRAISRLRNRGYKIKTVFQTSTGRATGYILSTEEPDQ